MKLINGRVVLPKGKDGYPNRDVVVKMYHFAGGSNEPKNFRLHFNEDIIKHIEYLVGDTDGRKETQTENIVEL
jgi:hypothetical protein